MIIEFLNGLQEGTQYELELKSIRLGRCDDADVLIWDKSVQGPLVQIERTDGDYFELIPLADELQVQFPGEEGWTALSLTLMCHGTCTLKTKDGLLLQICPPRKIPDSTAVHSQDAEAAANVSHSIAGSHSLPLSGEKHSWQSRRWVSQGIFLTVLLSLPISLFALGRMDKPKTQAEPTQATVIRQTVDTNNRVAVLEAAQYELSQALDIGQGSNVQIQTVLPDTLQISAQLTRREMDQFEKTISQLANDYGHQINLIASTSLNAEQQAIDELRLKKIVLGQMASATLDDGTVLYEGSRINDFEVVSINQFGVKLKKLGTFKLGI
ncbi:MAG TPA: hypothetical protein VGE55_13135 [Limnobacter sp.]|uniref:hypothetical protein n=1 Tax=Limnobacter sp. TaxID=2003368 RepID=UPI002EDAC549